MNGVKERRRGGSFGISVDLLLGFKDSGICDLEDDKFLICYGRVYS